MKLTKEKLKQIIREELKEVMNFDYGSPEDLPTGAFGAPDPDVPPVDDDERAIEYVETMNHELKKIGLAIVDVSAALRSFPGSLEELVDGIMDSAEVRSAAADPTLKRSYKDVAAKKFAAKLGL